MSGKTIVVTGGAGFLGTHLCHKLIQNGNEVYCLDNLSTGSRDNIRCLDEKDSFHFLKWDVTDRIYIRCDEIYNLACPASPVRYQKDPVSTLKTSFLGALNMLQMAYFCHARILQASTSEVYGNPAVNPQPEDYTGNVNINGIRSCYDEGKRAAESLFSDFKREYGVDIRIIRIFNTYGPGMDIHDGRVVSNFIVQALQNRDLTVYGDGSQTRSFCYVDDLIDGMVKMMETDGFSGPVNLGNPEEFSIKQLADMILRLTGSSSKIIFKKLPSDDPVQRKPDITLANDKLHWQPTVHLEKGLHNTIQYFSTALAAYNTLKK